MSEEEFGTIKNIIPDKGIAFIKPDRPSEVDVFLHRDTLHRSGVLEVRIGDRVAYLIHISRSGRPQASTIRKLEEAA